MKCLNDGIFLNIDTTTKFVQTKTILERINDLKKIGYSNSKISELLTWRFDENGSHDLGPEGLDDKRSLVIITSYNSARYQI